MRILMHEPTDELFLGVMHPDAALFSDYLNIEQAAAEHANYRRELTESGAKVLTVREILLKDTLDGDGKTIQGKALDDLREFASEFLIYNTDNIPGEAAAQEAYKSEVLAKASPRDLVRIIFLQPEIVLDSTESNTGITATYIQYPLMNMLYMRDQMIATSKGIVIGRMNSPQRETECRIAQFCLDKIGVPVIAHIEGEDAYLEGGDFLQFFNSAFIGCGLRTTPAAIEQLMSRNLLGYDRLMVVKDNWLEQEQMHLDTYFNVIDRDLATLSEERYKAGPDSDRYLTVDVYERSAEGAPYLKIAENMDFVDYLKNTLGMTVIPIAREDELKFANNYLTIKPRHIMAVAGQSQKLQDELRSLGVNVVWVPLTNLIRGYGAAHCMTQILEPDEVF